jgi:hypothetical protein
LSTKIRDQEELRESRKTHLDEKLKETGAAFGVMDVAMLDRRRQLSITYEKVIR